jgi:hypothetical protein
MEQELTKEEIERRAGELARRVMSQPPQPRKKPKRPDRPPKPPKAGKSSS